MSTPIEYEIENLKKCLAAGYPRVAVVLAKSRSTYGRYVSALQEAVSPDERAKISFLTPENLPDFIASLAAPTKRKETVVKGYRVESLARREQ